MATTASRTSCFATVSWFGASTACGNTTAVLSRGSLTSTASGSNGARRPTRSSTTSMSCRRASPRSATCRGSRPSLRTSRRTVASIFSVAWRGRSLDIVQGMQVSGSYFPALGLAPALGRLFGPEIDAPLGGHPVAVLSHEFWRDDLGGARDVLGRGVADQRRAVDHRWRRAGRIPRHDDQHAIHGLRAAHDECEAESCPGRGPLREPPELLALPVRPPEAAGLHRPGPRRGGAPVPQHPDRRRGAAPDGDERRDPGALRRQAPADRGGTARTEPHARERGCARLAPPGGHRRGPSDRVRQHREPAAGAIRRPRVRDGRAALARRDATAPGHATADRVVPPGRSRGRGRTGRGPLDARLHRHAPAA